MNSLKVIGGFVGGGFLFLLGIVLSVLSTILSLFLTSFSILAVASIIYATLSFFGVVPVVNYLPGIPYL